MEYLKKSFTIAVSSPTPHGHDSIFDLISGEQARRTQRERAAKPHEFLGANMCQVCGLGDKAKIHEL